MKTIKVPYTTDQKGLDLIAEIQKMQSPMIRTAYNSAADGLAEISVRADLRMRFVNSRLDSWFQQSAVKQGIGMFKADVETNRLMRVFGGKGNLIRRSKGLISNEDWKALRVMPIYLIGESPAKGNRKFNLEKDNVIFKPWKGEKIVITLPNMRSNWDELLYSAFRLANQKLLPITISLTTTHICFSFDDAKVRDDLKKFKPVKNRYAGIDLNPNYIGVSVFDGERLISTKLFDMKDLTGKHKSNAKIDHETYQIGHSVGEWLRHLKVDKLFIEDLSFSQSDKGLGKNFNRLTTNQWKKTKFKAALQNYFPKSMFPIGAAYTSTIGNVINSNLPDPVAASTAIAKRGFELVILKSKKYFPELPTLKELEDRWKETEFPVCNDWKELHRFIKNARLKYRVPIPEREGFRKFKSTRSSVYVIDDFRYT